MKYGEVKVKCRGRGPAITTIIQQGSVPSSNFSYDYNFAKSNAKAQISSIPLTDVVTNLPGKSGLGHRVRKPYIKNKLPRT